MTVYVDDAFIPAKVGRITSKWCHLTADTQEELHTFAQSIGLLRTWFQPGRPRPNGTPSDLWHYDVTEGKRAQAVAHGAKSITAREAIQVILDRRARSVT